MIRHSSFVPLADGNLLHVECSGLDTQLPVCLMVHGYGDGAFVWHEVCAALAGECATVTVDLRGHGASEWSSDGHYELATHVADVASAITTLRLNRFVLIGHSLGGQVAMRIAARYPQQIAALMLVDVSPERNPRGVAQMLANLRASLQIYPRVDHYQRWLRESRPMLTEAMAWGIAGRALRACEGGFQLKFDPALAHPRDPQNTDRYKAETWEVLSAIECPTLIVRGAASALVGPQAAERMTRALKHGRLAVIPQAGHAVMSDNAQAFNALALEFVRSVAGSGSKW